MKVLVVSQYYPPEIGATQNRMAEFVRGIAALGHHVDVLTEVPNHPAGVIAPEYRGRWMAVEEAGSGIRVWRVWVAASPRKTFWRRLAFYGSFVAMAMACAPRLSRRYDVVAATSPPLPAGAAGLALARLKHAAFVLDVRDLWPKAAGALGELSNPIAYRAAEWLERRLYRAARAITATTQGFCEYICERGGAGRVEHVPNGTRLDLFSPARGAADVRARLGLDGAFVVAYAGLHGIAQGLEDALRAAALLADAPVRFLFVGDGPEKSRLIQEARHLGLRNVTFQAAVPPDQAAHYLNAADAVLVPLARNAVFETFVPSKLFDAMACARPVLLAVDGEARRILESAGAGRFVPAGDPEGLAEAVRALVADPHACRDMGARGRAFVSAGYSREMQARRFAEIVESAAGAQG